MKGIICYSENPLVSSDLNHDPNSATFASLLTKVLDGDLVKIIAWYDNEWGFANRMIDVARIHASERLSRQSKNYKNLVPKRYF